MPQKILIAYGTKAGSTAEVAQAIGEEMQTAGAQVDIKPVEDVKDITSYDAVVVGTAVRMFKILGKTKRFLRAQKRALEKVPVAYFLLCLTMGEETPENIRQAKDYAKPMLSTKDPVNLGLFGGCIDHSKLNDIFGKTMKAVPEQDHRNWDQIRSWARDTFEKLV